MRSLTSRLQRLEARLPADTVPIEIVIRCVDPHGAIVGTYTLTANGLKPREPIGRAVGTQNQVTRLVMRTIIRRVAKLEDRIAWKPTAQDRRSAEIADLLRERRRRYLEATGQPFHEAQSVLPLDYNGPRLGIAETLRMKREWWLARREATGGTGDQH